jgi:hypothetical protein
VARVPRLRRVVLLRRSDLAQPPRPVRQHPQGRLRAQLDQPRDPGNLSFGPLPDRCLGIGAERGLARRPAGGGGAVRGRGRADVGRLVAGVSLSPPSPRPASRPLRGRAVPRPALAPLGGRDQLRRGSDPRVPRQPRTRDPSLRLDDRLPRRDERRAAGQPDRTPVRSKTSEAHRRTRW